jgi:hypothetical protein
MIESTEVPLTQAEMQVFLHVTMLLSWIAFRDGDDRKTAHMHWPTELVDQSLDSLAYDEKLTEIKSPRDYIEKLPPGSYLGSIVFRGGGVEKFSREHLLSEFDFTCWGYCLFPLENPKWIIHKAFDPIAVTVLINVYDYCCLVAKLPSTDF